MLKQIIIISIFLSFCFGQVQVTLTADEVNEYIDKLNYLNNEIKELESDRKTLIKDGSNLEMTEKSADDMVVMIEGLIESYETKIGNLAAEIAKTQLRNKQLKYEKKIHTDYRNELDSMKVDWKNKLSELADKHRDVTNFRNEMEVKLKSEPKGTLDEEQVE